MADLRKISNNSDSFYTPELFILIRDVSRPTTYTISKKPASLEEIIAKGFSEQPKNVTHNLRVRQIRQYFKGPTALDIMAPTDKSKDDLWVSQKNEQFWGDLKNAAEAVISKTQDLMLGKMKVSGSDMANIIKQVIAVAGKYDLNQAVSTIFIRLINKAEKVAHQVFVESMTHTPIDGTEAELDTQLESACTTTFKTFIQTLSEVESAEWNTSEPYLTAKAQLQQFVDKEICIRRLEWRNRQIEKNLAEAMRQTQLVNQEKEKRTKMKKFLEIAKNLWEKHHEASKTITRGHKPGAVKNVKDGLIGPRRWNCCGRNDGSPCWDYTNYALCDWDENKVKNYQDTPANELDNLIPTLFKK